MMECDKWKRPVLKVTPIHLVTGFTPDGTTLIDPRSVAGRTKKQLALLMAKVGRAALAVSVAIATRCEPDEAPPLDDRVCEGAAPRTFGGMLRKLARTAVNARRMRHDRRND